MNLQKKMERKAKEALSNNFEGKRSAYNGGNDPYLHFGNAKNFDAEKRNALQFAFKIKSTLGIASVICINPANFDVLGVIVDAVDGTAGTHIHTPTMHFHNKEHLVNAGHVCDAVLDDGKIIDNGAQYLEITTPKASIRQMLDFVRRNPSRVTQMIIQANDHSFYEGVLTVKDANPFKMQGEEVIPLTDSFSPNQNQDKKILIDTDEYNLQLDNQTLLFIDVPAQANGVDDVEAIVTMKIGAVENSSKALKRKALTAKVSY